MILGTETQINYNTFNINYLKRQDIITDLTEISKLQN